MWCHKVSGFNHFCDLKFNLIDKMLLFRLTVMGHTGSLNGWIDWFREPS